VLRSGWRRFRPHVSRRAKRNSSSGGLFAQVHQDVDQIVQDLRRIYGRKLRYHHLEDHITEQRERAAATNEAHDFVTLLVLQAPRAVQAQIAMDEHPHGYRDRHERLYELIDFNDSFDDAVLACPDELLSTFSEQARKEMDWLCQQLRTTVFSDKQYEAIVHGLSREIAVYRAALQAGYSVRMTSRRDDAFGIDMVIGDPVSGRELNIDCKTSSSYFLRLQDLLRESRISEATELQAEHDGFVRVVNRGDGRSAEVTILRIDSSILGPITNFAFESPEPFAALLQQAFKN
jgi:hypothetical protein